MVFNLELGDILTHKQLHRTFECSVSGGIRYSSKTETIVIISDPTDPFYQDYWEGDVLHYTGSGRIGDQKISRENKRLANLNNSNINAYLFEKLRTNHYEFIGEVKLADDPYQEEQLDDNSDLRKVWMFPIEIINSYESVCLSEDEFNLIESERNKIVKNTDDQNLKKRAMNSNKKSGTRQVNTTKYVRDPYVAEFAKHRANGVCQLCEEKAPFENNDGEPYLEAHHIEWLSNGGEDSIDNTVALCPNCHKKMHIVNDKDDINKLKNKIKA